MKVKHLLFSGSILSLGLAFALLTSSTQKIDGPPPAVSGGPSEKDCAMCHQGSAGRGSATPTLTIGDNVTAYEPGQTYTITLAIPDAGSNTNGFQLSARAGDNFAGNFIVTDAVNTQLNPMDEHYIQHTRSGHSDRKEWTFDWKAPDTQAGIITFYAACILANSDGRGSGDSLYKWSKTLDQVSAVEKSDILPGLNIYPNPVADFLNLDFYMAEKATLGIQILDLNGKTVFQHSYGVRSGKQNLSVDLQSLVSGTYLVKMLVGSKVSTQKIQIQ